MASKGTDSSCALLRPAFRGGKGGLEARSQGQQAESTVEHYPASCCLYSVAACRTLPAAPSLITRDDQKEESLLKKHGRTNTWDEHPKQDFLLLHTHDTEAKPMPHLTIPRRLLACRPAELTKCCTRSRRAQQVACAIYQRAFGHHQERTRFLGYLEICVPCIERKPCFFALKPLCYALHADPSKLGSLSLPACGIPCLDIIKGGRVRLWDSEREWLRQTLGSSESRCVCVLSWENRRSKTVSYAHPGLSPSRCHTAGIPPTYLSNSHCPE